MKAKIEALDYLNGMKKLTPLEYEVMKFIWKYPDGIQSKDIYETLPKSRSTISTALYKISEKGYLTNKQVGRHHVYTTLVSELEYERAVLKQQLKKTNGDGSFEQLVAAFFGKDSLTKKQRDKLQHLIKEFEDAIEVE